MIDRIHHIIEGYYGELNHFVFAKDRNGKFLFCNENFARASGLDSPNQLIGKTDDDACWRDQADFFREGDGRVMAGGVMLNVYEIQTQPDKIADIIVTKNKLYNRSNKCIGIVGTFLDITGYQLIQKSGYFVEDKKRFYLGGKFANEYFTKREVDVFRLILLGYTTTRIAGSLGIKPKTVDYFIEKIRLKLQCSSKAEIIAAAITHGFTYLLNEDNEFTHSKDDSE